MSKEKVDQSILEDAKKFRDDASAYWQPIYDKGREDKEFAIEKGKQWDTSAIAKRKSEGKPTLEFNLVHTYCKQQVNTHKQNRPQIQVVPVDSGADEDKAKILSGLIKDTEEASDFESANDVAVENAVYSGIGFLRIITDFIHEKSFNQEPRYKSIHNPEAVLIDPLSREIDGSDNDRALVCEWVDKAQIEKEFGDDAVSDFEFDGAENWHDQSKDTILIAEYFYKDSVRDTLIMLEDGTSEFKSVLLEQWSEDELKLVTVDERATTRTEIKWAKLSGCKVLETGIFPGQHIPIIPVYGEVVWVGEERKVFSLVHFATDPQRLFNYWKSAEASILQKNQDEMTIVDDRGIASFEEWKNPSKAQYLRFRATDDNGNQIPYPTKMGAATPPVGILNASESAKSLIADTLNMHAPNMGQDVNQQSGKAIGLLQRQGETSQFHFQDNDNKSIRHCGRILLGLYPVLYDTPLVRRIVGTDGETKMVKLNAQPQTEDEFDKAIGGILNDMTVGRFDIRIDTGPSFNTQREQSFQLMMQLAQFAPNIMQCAGDLIIKDSPLLNSKEIADRVKKMMPPQVLGDGQINPEQAKAQITQLDQLVQKLTGELDVLKKQVADKTEDRNIDMLKAQINAEKDIQVAQINASSRSDVQELRGTVELLKQRIDISNAPQNWVEQGEGVENYAPSQPQQTPQLDGFDPPPDMSQSDFQNPANEQGFLMPEQMDQQENFAPDFSQVGESAMATGDLMPPMENQDDNQF